MRIQLRLNEAGLGIACQLCFFCSVLFVFFCSLQKLLILNGTNVCDAAEESGRLLISQCENSCLSWFHCRNPEGAGEVGGTGAFLAEYGRRLDGERWRLTSYTIINMNV